MKFSKLVVSPDGVLQKIVVTPDSEGLPLVAVTPLTVEETRKVVDTYNTVLEAAEGANGLPYQITFQLLKEEDVAEPVETV